MDNASLYSHLGINGFQEGNVDLLAIIRDEPRESYTSRHLPSDVSAYSFISGDSFRLDISQEPVLDVRYAGEGAESNTYMIPNISFRGSFDMPLLAPAMGYVDPTFALLWDYCRLAFYGTAGVAKTSPISPVSPGQFEINISNIAEFMFLQDHPETLLIIKEGDNIDEFVVTRVSKKDRLLIVSPETPITFSYSTDAEIIAVLPRNADIPREPSFSLLSVREGIMTPCLINKLTIDISADKSVTISVDVAALGINREIQIEARSKMPRLFSFNKKTNRVVQVLHGSLAKIYPYNLGTGNYGSDLTIGDALFGGYEYFQPITGSPYEYITGISITIDNNLKDAYALHSIKSDAQQRRRENSFPFGIYSEGRTIKGSIKYRHSLDQLGFMERLAGININGSNERDGVTVECGGLKISVPNLVWSPSTSESAIDEYQNRTLNWTMAAENWLSMPELEYKLGI